MSVVSDPIAMGVDVAPRWPERVRLVYPAGNSVDLAIDATIGGIVWDPPTAVQLADRGISGTLTTSMTGIRSIDAPEGYYFWTLPHSDSPDARNLVTVPPTPIEVLLFYDQDDPDTKATATVNVRQGGVKGCVWSVPDALVLESHGYPIINVPQPPNYVKINSRAPGCTILNGVVVCYA